MYLEWYQIVLILAVVVWAHNHEVKAIRNRYEAIRNALESFVEHVNNRAVELDEARDEFVANYAHSDKIDPIFPEDLIRLEFRQNEAIEALDSFGFGRLRSRIYKYGDVVRGVYK